MKKSKKKKYYAGIAGHPRKNECEVLATSRKADGGFKIRLGGL